jgi:hypothetical protein
MFAHTSILCFARFWTLSLLFLIFFTTLYPVMACSTYSNRLIVHQSLGLKLLLTLFSSIPGTSTFRFFEKEKSGFCTFDPELPLEIYELFWPNVFKARIFLEASKMASPKFCESSVTLSSVTARSLCPVRSHLSESLSSLFKQPLHLCFLQRLIVTHPTAFQVSAHGTNIFSTMRESVLILLWSMVSRAIPVFRLSNFKGFDSPSSLEEGNHLGISTVSKVCETCSVRMNIRKSKIRESMCLIKSRHILMAPSRHLVPDMSCCRIFYRDKQTPR